MERAAANPKKELIGTPSYRAGTCNERMYSQLLTQILMFNFLMLFSLLRHIMSFPSMYYCYFLNNNQSCHSDTVKKCMLKSCWAEVFYMWTVRVLLPDPGAPSIKMISPPYSVFLKISSSST